MHSSLPDGTTVGSDFNFSAERSPAPEIEEINKLNLVPFSLAKEGVFRSSISFDV